MAISPTVTWPTFVEAFELHPQGFKVAAQGVPGFGHPMPFERVTEDVRERLEDPATTVQEVDPDEFTLELTAVIDGKKHLLVYCGAPTEALLEALYHTRKHPYRCSNRVRGAREGLIRLLVNAA